MHQKFYLFPLGACLASTMASTVHAAEPLALQKTTLQNVQQQFQMILPGVKQISPTSSANSLSFLKSHTDKNKINHIRMQQKYAGFNVFGGYAIMHSPESVKSMVSGHDNVNMNGVVYQGIDADLGKPSTDFVQNGKSALENFKDQFRGKTISDEHVTPLVYIDDKHKAHWAYKVTMLLTHDDQIPERPTAIVDAVSYTPFIQWNDIKTAARIPAKGLGYGGNRKVGMYTFGIGMPHLELTRDSEGKIRKCYMENKDVG
jgi:pseudolysin